MHENFFIEVCLSALFYSHFILISDFDVIFHIDLLVEIRISEKKYYIEKNNNDVGTSVLLCPLIAFERKHDRAKAFIKNKLPKIKTQIC